MDNIRIIFMGTPNFACGIFKTLLDMNANIVASVSQPDKRVGRKMEIKMTPVKELSLEHNIPCIQPIRIKEEYNEVLKYKPDLIVTCAYGQIIPKEMIEYPKYGCINVHASLLPKYRGGAPIQRAIINGDKETGVTIMEMVQKMDAGDMIASASLTINDDDTTSSLFDRLMVLGSNLLKEKLEDYVDGKITPIKQDESKVVIAPNISKEEEFISFKDTTRNVYNHIRGLIDWPIGYGVCDNKKYKFYKVRYLNEKNETGKVIGLIDNALAIGTMDGTILIDIIQQEGKNKQHAKDFFNGAGKNLVNKYFE